MSKKCWRKLIVLSALVSLISVAHYAEAQWGTNTTPCPTHCGPASPWWGYVQTRWNRWPGATYPDMQKVPGVAGEGVPVPSVDLPRPNKESEIRSTPSSDYKAPESTPNTSEAPTESSSEPTPAKPFSAPKPMDMPSVKDAPGASAPGEEPLFTPPSTAPSPADLSTPPNPAEPAPVTPPANNGSSLQPKTRLRAMQAKFDAASAGSNEWSVPRESKTDKAAVKADTATIPAAKPLRLKLDVDDFSRPMSSEQSTASSSSGQGVSHTVAASGQASVASGNPLRLEVVPSSSSEETSQPGADSRAGSAYNSDATSYSTPTSYQR
jgi:hypothetical protein